MVWEFKHAAKAISSGVYVNLYNVDRQIECTRYGHKGLKSSVADPDQAVLVFLCHPYPDPGQYRIRILYPQKDPCNSNFLVI